MRTLRNALSLGILPILLVHTSTPVAGAEEKPFDYFYNSWNWVGLRNYRNLARVTPDNAILLEGKNELRFKYGQNPKPNLERISRRHTKTALDGWLPVLLFSAEDGPLRYEFKYWATPLPTVKDWRKAFDWPTEGGKFPGVGVGYSDQYRLKSRRGEAVGGPVRRHGVQSPSAFMAACARVCRRGGDPGAVQGR